MVIFEGSVYSTVDFCKMKLNFWLIIMMMMMMGSDDALVVHDV